VQIIYPHDFKRLPWKNGKGETIELAINEDGSLADFDWRISMASVTDDGPFSDFSGYQRHLLLLEGTGIELTHLDGTSINNTINNGENKVDHQERHDLQRLETQILDTPLGIAAFDGALATSGKLIAGPIRDISSNTSTKFLTLASNQLLFFYAVKGDSKFNIGNQTTTLPQGHLLKLIGDQTGNSVDISLTGEQVIIMSLSIKSPQY
jgi:environmental stress-induced protein Ves